MTISSKGAPNSNESPSTMKEGTKKNTTTASTSKQTSTDKSPLKEKEKQEDKEKEVIPSISPISLDLTHKILGDLKLDYDVVEDLKKMKGNITVFESCKIKQLREQL